MWLIGRIKGSKTKARKRKGHHTERKGAGVGVKKMGGKANGKKPSATWCTGEETRKKKAQRDTELEAGRNKEKSNLARAQVFVRLSQKREG